MAQQGASVTALDFSPTALERAREIAALAGVTIDTVLAEATSLSGEEHASLHGSFDLERFTSASPHIGEFLLNR